MRQSFMDHLSDRRLKVIVSLFLLFAVLFLYWRVQDYAFIDYDDNMYVFENPHIKSGFTGAALSWALSDTHTGHWHPLTWLSHIMDWTLYGNNAGGHHWTNLLWHLANTLLLFLVLEAMTGELWKSAFVALLFALHPLNVESVAWVAERKNVLSTFFWFAAMGAYTGYAKRRGIRRYALVCLFFAMGLMAKPMLVSLPFVLLLLDYWPLQRFSIGEHKRDAGQKESLLFLLKEKIPLFVLAAVSGAITVYAAQAGGALRSMAAFPLELRLGNAALSLIGYIGKVFVPIELSVFYPFAPVSFWKAVGAAFALAGVTGWVSWKARRHRYLIVGWLWYLVVLLPVIGIVQVGYQSMADRYAYVSGIGLFMIVAWGVPELMYRCTFRKPLLVFVSAALVFLFSGSAWRQVSYWRGSLPLFQHALQVTENNHIAHLALGAFLLKTGRVEEAGLHLDRAIKIKPDSAEAQNNMGIVLLERGDYPGAYRHFAEAVRIMPDFEKAYNNIGILLLRAGKKKEALPWFEKALNINPYYGEAKRNLMHALRDSQSR